MDVYLARTDDIDERLRAFFLPFVSPGKRARINHLKRNADAVLLGDILIKYAIYTSFGIPVKEQNISCDAYGKPQFLGAENVHFNLSHSENIIVCATDCAPVGIDIQKIRPVSHSLLETVCTKDEKEAIRQAENPNAAFCRIWTQKEAIAKWKGTGLVLSALKQEQACCHVESIRFEDFYISTATKKTAK